MRPFTHVGLLAVLLLSVVAALPAEAAGAQSWGQRLEGTLFWTQAQREARFHKMPKLFPADRVAHGKNVHALPQGKPLVPRWTDSSMTLAKYMKTWHLAGVMVLQNGRIRLERYALGFGPGERWTSFSVAKSITSVLLGVALKQGYVHNLSNTVSTYIPRLSHSAYADVTVRELLTMTSGVRWNENYTDPDSDVAKMYLGPCHDHEPHIVSYLSKLPREWPAGTHWHYDTAEIDLLGILIQRATQRSLATYLSQSIWKPWGMASDAWWLKDPCGGVNLGGSGFSATLADYARFGQFMLEGARIDGKPIVAKAWMRGALHREEKVATPGRGYGYLWWTDSGGDYAAIGIFGQLIYIDPKLRLVIVQLGAWPKPDSDREVAARRAFVAAVKRGAAGTGHHRTPKELRQAETVQLLRSNSAKLEIPSKRLRK